MRVADGESPWQTGTASLGRFNLTGASCTQTPTPTPSPSPTPTQVPQPTPVTETPLTFPTYSNIYISEALVAQDAGQSEWIELYNDNDFTVDLVDWYLDDGEDVGSSPQIFSIEIPKKGYEIFELSSPMFNNSGDTVRLLDFQKQEKDSFSYSKATKGKTLGRTSFAEDKQNSIVQNRFFPRDFRNKITSNYSKPTKI
ncbi:lamin tail domain-containing protein [Candidatus Roizmanbacteria bacterium]|nr:lamin tail domain-containing protein [Candidatus Roizmanbacteria bacterium]